jgi:iron complex transport system substrate-binding protein
MAGFRHRKLADWLLASLVLASGAVAAADAPKPQRIVSINYCTDQLLLRLVEPERIVSLTFLSWAPGDTPPEYVPVLKHLKPNHGLAEEVLRMNPDLVLSGTFSSHFTNDLLQRLGRSIHIFQPEGNFEEWYERVRRLGDAVGEPERAEKMVADFKQGLAALQAQIPPGEMPIYADLEVNSWMPGKDTFYTRLVNAGGFRTAGETMGYSGYQAIPLERLIKIDAALISTNRQYEHPPSIATQNLRHPLLRLMAKKAYAAIDVTPRYTLCTTPETLKMIGQLVEARKDIDAAKARAAGAPAQR